MQETLVTISCLAYNHERYIKDAIEGFLMQNTDFKYEIIIHDDASTDGTAEIIREYEKKYPEVIHGIYEQENMYSKSKKGGEIERKMCKMYRGKYIAFCEGDDYWTDPYKLKIQVDYMEKHPECMISVHNAFKLNCKDDSKQKMAHYKEERDLLPGEVIMDNSNIATASYVIRNEVMEMDNFFWEAGIGDYPKLLFGVNKGKVHYFDRVMAVYRCGHNGSWSVSCINDIKKFLLHIVKVLALLEKYNIYTNQKYDVYVKEKMQAYSEYAVNRCKDMPIDQFVACCAECDKQNDYEYGIYYKEVKRLYYQMHIESYCGKDVREFALSHSHVLIWGAGKYGKLIAKQLANNGIRVEGFIVSDNQQSEVSCLGMPIWKVKNLPYRIEEIGIIVGVGRMHWNAVHQELIKNGIMTYMCPFLFASNKNEE